MKFTDGAWLHRPGVTASYAAQAAELSSSEGELTLVAPVRELTHREDTLDGPLLSVRLWSPREGVIGVRIEHFDTTTRTGFDLPGAETDGGRSHIDKDGTGHLDSGGLRASIRAGAPWSLEFTHDGVPLTRSEDRSIGLMQVDPRDGGASIGIAPSLSGTGIPVASRYVLQQLTLGIGEQIYGLGERFGPLVKNGQSVEVWNSDGGTATEQSYKNIPFYLSSKGYGVLVNDSGHVGFEIGSERVARLQFAVPGDVLEYFVIAGPTPLEALGRYTALTGRPARIPSWSYGLWLSTSFTTDYDEATVNGFLDEFAERDIPLSVFHFDCFWMREHRWVDFQWNSEVFPDPAGMLRRLHERGLKVCVWINPYIAQRSELFAEASRQGYLLRRPDGTTWQTDYWQAGMGIVDFTNPDAVRWYQDHLRALLAQGVDTVKTDFGERIPTDVAYFDGSDPGRMHNLFAQLYNRAVFEVVEEAQGVGRAVLFARSATTGGQSMPVHWGGDNEATFESMAETLRGGLSLSMSGFGYWSHDIGGFEGTPDPALFKRWLAFGMLSTHSRLHGRASYRVPWNYDDGSEAPGQSAVDVAREFGRLKMRLMPYLATLGHRAAEEGHPVVRAMVLEFPNDPTARLLDRQYMLGDSLLVAPVFSAHGDVEFYLPEGTWTNFWTGEQVAGGGWRTEQHDYATLPLYVREGAVIPWGARDDRPDYALLEDLELRLFPGALRTARSVWVADEHGQGHEYTIAAGDGGTVIASASGRDFSVRLPEGTVVASQSGRVTLAAD